MDPIQRTTSTGKVLTLLTKDMGPPDQPEEPTRAQLMEAQLARALIDSEEGEIVALCILAIPASRMGMKIYTTVTVLGDLLILRDEFDDFLVELRNPRGDGPDSAHN